MFKPVSRAGTPIITPPLRSEDSTLAVANANTEALISAAMTAGRYNGIVQFPVGNIYFDNPVEATGIFDERHAGIVIRGAGPGKTVLVPVSAKGFDFISRLVDGRSQGTIPVGFTDRVEIPNPTDYVEGEVIYFWNVQSGPLRSERIRLRVQNVNLGTGVVLHSGSSEGYSDFMHVKGFAVNGPAGAGQPIPAGTLSVRFPLTDLAFVAFFAPCDDVLLGDGPGINEFRGEWLTVAEVNPGTGDITFTTPTVQGYEASLACLVPGYQPFPGGGRQHMSDITLQDLSIAAPPGNPPPALGLVRAGLRFTYDNVGFRTHPSVAAPTTPADMQFVTCGRTSFRDVTLNGRLYVATSQNANFDNVTASAVHVQEYARDCVFTACRTNGPGGFTVGPLECRHIDLTNCTFRNYASTAGVANVAFASDSAITGVQLRQPLNDDDPVVLTGQNIRVTTLASDSPVTLAANSSGELLSPLAAGQVSDLSGPPGAWDQPLTVRRDGVVRVPTFAILSAYGPDLVVQAGASTKVALQVRGQTGQSEDLQQWQDASGATLLAVRLDGYLETSKTEDAGDVTSTILKKLKVYLPDGSSYYLALYNDL